MPQVVLYNSYNLICIDSLTTAQQELGIEQVTKHKIHFIERLFHWWRGGGGGGEYFPLTVESGEVQPSYNVVLVLDITKYDTSLSFSYSTIEQY